MIKTLIKSTRISWAAKNLNMYLLVLTYAYFADIFINNPFEILEGLILVSALWGALYSLNDLTDLEYDRKDKEKQKRPFIQEHVEKKWIILFCTIIISSVFVIAVTTLRFSFTIILGLMLLNQLLYTVPPIRLKDTIFAPFSSTATNSILRMASCAVLLGNIFIVPLSVYIFMYTASMGTYIMYKSKQTAASALTLISGVILVYAFLVGDMNLIQFAVAVLPAFLATIPLYLSLFTQKDKMFDIADILYHQIAMLFFLISIIYILFFHNIPL
ncbi:UbiA family prenyltransferase [Methanobacterium spitsbergense]|uniref:Prenyltransferase n=1 Tax=Methanobacterium spitsbergense TaxID=2874285 RepID=A0A8T5UQ20_9EURY|nr:UbiA family prenyltransferase [Methanobacterium spitsbergense]MBZ2165744.1 prenyltransferase [Methanobacterium spitsbergense]